MRSFHIQEFAGQAGSLEQRHQFHHRQEVGGIGRKDAAQLAVARSPIEHRPLQQEHADPGIRLVRIELERALDGRLRIGDDLRGVLL